MPELPEVETTRRGIAPHLLNHTIEQVIVRNRQLRWPVPTKLSSLLQGQSVLAVKRRGKYLLIEVANGTLLVHLGMSGSLRVLPCSMPAEKHDHVDIVFSHNQCLRLRDPRRFGAVLWTDEDPLQHKLLKQLGPEPLSKAFSATYLIEKAARRKVTIKQFIMDSKIVVGVGNIYASEALFLAGIHPKRQAGRISLERLDKLVKAIKKVLQAAIKQGGTTLRDFTASDGKPGYFSQQLNVYGRSGEACPRCGKPVKQMILGQRSTYYCSHCQK